MINVSKEKEKGRILLCEKCYSDKDCAASSCKFHITVLLGEGSNVLYS